MSEGTAKQTSSLIRWIKRVILGLLLSLVLGATAMFGLKTWVVQWADTPMVQIKQQDIVIKAGYNTRKVIKLLKKESGITKTWAFKVLFLLSPELTQLKVGHYEIPEAATPNQLFGILISGVEKQFAITFIEGSTFGEWLDILQTNTQINYDDERIASYISSFKPTTVDENKYRYARVEGQFFPDTYHFNANTKAVEVLRRAHKSLNVKLDKLWAERQSKIPLMNKEQALVLASIIEKETGIASERDTIASAFTNRLNIKMRLQTDPTVIYGMADVYDGDITYSHLRDKNEYNTYVIKGLPPTPIAMASEGAIKAALNPANTPYIYFVASGNGGHVFSTNLADHNRATKRYLQQLKQQ